MFAIRSKLLFENYQMINNKSYTAWRRYILMKQGMIEIISNL